MNCLASYLACSFLWPNTCEKNSNRENLILPHRVRGVTQFVAFWLHLDPRQDWPSWQWIRTEEEAVRLKIQEGTRFNIPSRAYPLGAYFSKKPQHLKFLAFARIASPFGESAFCMGFSGPFTSKLQSFLSWTCVLHSGLYWDETWIVLTCGRKRVTFGRWLLLIPCGSQGLN